LNHPYFLPSPPSLPSTFLPTITHITHLNPFPPHYISTHSKTTHFFHHASLPSPFHLPHNKSSQSRNHLIKQRQDI
ncbi:hypothetical protein, partial [Staphylococcus pasteuri]|uniref:hypothetical protein n=1 Tax=Staphylococcus pasteuri TaxID=45972 RepID=UPI001C994CE0